jgi:hypothetical protein
MVIPQAPLAPAYGKCLAPLVSAYGLFAFVMEREGKLGLWMNDVLRSETLLFPGKPSSASHSLLYSACPSSSRIHPVAPIGGTTAFLTVLLISHESLGRNQVATSNSD